MIDIVFSIYLPRFFNWVIETSIMASILVGLILCVKILLRNKLTPRWHYLLWMILIVRLLLPWTPGSSFSIYSILLNGYESIISVQSPSIVSSENEHSQGTISLSETKVVKEEQGSPVNTPQMIEKGKKGIMIRNEKQKDESEPLSIYTIALNLWLTGVIIFGFTTYLVNRRLHKYIKQQPIITDERVVKTFENCKKSMAIQRNIPLLLAGKIPSPTVLGFFQPKVLLSSDYINRLDEQQLRHIFHHELAHIKRSDVGLNWLMHYLIILNWFNPIIWFAYVYMREDQELACDAYALSFMEEEEKIPYGYTIINLLEHYANYFPIPSVANLSRNKRTLKRRILMIKKFKKKSYRWSALGVIAVVAVASVSLLNANADGSNGKKEEKSTGKEEIIETKAEATVYTPPKQNENYKEMTKEEILTKMINSVDYFETAKGEFKIHNGNIDNADDYMLIEYELSLNNNAGGYNKESFTKNGEGRIISYKDGTLWYINESDGTYQEREYQDDRIHFDALTPESAFSVDNEGIDVTNYRERPPIGQAMSSLFPYEIASNFTRDLNKWEIENQNAELLGHNVLIIKGQINRMDSKSFRFWVDKDTGILVKYETYNSDGEIVDYLYPTKLEVNVPIDSKKFTPNLEGYKKEDMLGRNVPRMITGNIDELIPEELKEQWEEAKKNPNETTILHQNDKWYIHAKKGYLVDRIEVNGREGTLLLSKVSPQKSQFTFHALAQGYKIDTLKVAD
ncbi:M56 family metallopeptidase [Cytobacillus sp. Hz8]|uniref:M56 family metallopeptidase n=1 Tax=Cytobacillus sp. Hz8 TaxID=3347168 RepID=UPI0035DB1AB9